MNIYYISEFSDRGHNAGSKARNDIEKMFEDFEWRKINNNAIVSKMSERNSKYFAKSFIGALQLFFKIIAIKKGVIFCQYPVVKGPILHRALNIAKKKNKLCFIIHDIDALRAPKEQRNNLLDNEIVLLNKASALIVHNNNMREVLEGNGLTVKVVEELNLFDYLAVKSTPKPREISRTVVYAGNLKKGSFLDELSSLKELNFQLNLYGSNFDSNRIQNENIVYKGSFAPNEVVENLDGSFGLVWDGPSIETCDGLFGEYTRYNNPHKLSLYVAAGLPVIVWSKAAISKFVTENNIGFTIDSLSEIPNRFNDLDDTSYNEYIKNINNLRDKTRSGFYTEKAIVQVIERIEP
ncbi:hypothetical protein [Robertmurraya andreesenii]|uniref:Beta-1,6-galactofuranosyltransferase n=1 Tax=Anoxybacillus andreesenii TaxID=1325932 RepID=A0ABT9UZS2_9BACL|nr:hypothetical protein [Robertmurraya andreesenii]MDQ0154190.1 hypothetical protein [Robertmurraya andreesenii]